MKLKSFQVKNYRSITDSGLITLSDLDNVTVFAGQNESGKSSLLNALRDFENEEFSADSEPFSTDSKPVQLVSCTYTIESSDNFHKSLSAMVVDDNSISVEEGVPVLDQKIISKIASFTLTRTKQSDQTSLSLDDQTFKLIQASILDRPSQTPDSGEKPEDSGDKQETNDLSTDKYIDLSDDKNSDVSETLFRLTPKIVYFDDFCDLLPDSVLLTDLKAKKNDIEGYKAVKNLENILGVDFAAKDQEQDAVRRTKEENENNKISIDFQEDWGQRIHGENEVLVEYNFEKRNGEGPDGSYINFFVQTKKGQRLPPKKRSKGLIWFLSLWLELKALDNSNNDLVLLLDEPDQHLHVKAQDDILKLINKLATTEDQKGDQIIYATHSPYLIETDKLNRIKLVVNDADSGTIVEDVVTSKINTDNKRDALQPISNAIGLSASGFSTLLPKNVLLEGVSDFYYFSAMKKVLNRGGDYGFLPGIGVRQINNLISLCIGYGLEWISVIDDDPSMGGVDSKKKFDEIKDNVFDGDDDETKKKVHILEGVVGIENMFTIEDLKLINDKLGNSKDMVKVVGKKRKILFSKLFFEKANNGEILKENLSKQCIEKFTKSFDFIQSSLEL